MAAFLTSVSFKMKSVLDVQTKNPKGRRKEISIDRRQTTTSASPIDALHDDVLYQIFCQCVKVVMTREMSSCCYITIAPNNLAAVCKRWRSIALDSPVLWSGFICNRHFDRDWRMFQLYLDRAKDAPFRTIIDARNFNPEFCNDKLTQFLTDHQSHASLIGIAYGRHLVMQTMHLKHAPLLRHLTLKGCIQIRLDAMCRLDNLVSFELVPVLDDGLAVNTYLMLLHASPNLEVFRVRNISYGFSEDALTDEASKLPDVHLSKLSTFEFKRTLRGLSGLRILLEKLCLPALKELILECHRNWDDVELCGFQDFFLRSRPSLETLESNDFDCTELELLLELSPALRNLTISRQCTQREQCAMLRRLIITKDAYLCPAIETLTFLDLFCSDEFLIVVECLVLSRWRSADAGFPRSLRTVRFSKCSGDGHLPDGIRKCRDEGLEIDIWECYDYDDGGEVKWGEIIGR